MYYPNSDTYTVIEGHAIELRCKAKNGTKNNELITWSWLFEDEILVEGENLEFRVLNSTESFLNLKNVQKNQRGSYYCRAKNSLGEDSMSIKLRVKGK